MNIAGLSSLLSGTNGTEQHRLFLQGGKDLGSDLQAGQIIKGRVMRQIDGSRYSMDINGRERVVDSSIPMKADEIIQGRVMAVGDRVEIRRINLLNSHASEDTRTLQNNWGSLLAEGNPGKKAIELFQQYRASLTTNEQKLLAQNIRATNSIDAMLLAALMIKKIGLSLSQEVLAIMSSVLSSKQDRKFQLTELAAVIDIESAQVGTHNETSKALSPLLSHLMQESIESGRRDKRSMSEQSSSPNLLFDDMPTMDGSASQDTERHSDRGHQSDWAQLLFNLQGQGNVSHRTATLPVIVNGRLIEVDVAMFSQRQVEQEGLFYRKLVFSLDLDELGHIEIEAKIANRNIRINVSTDQDASTSELARYMSRLSEELKQFDWNVDELSYSTVTNKESGGVLHAVVEHYITQDSLSRLY